MAVITGNKKRQLKTDGHPCKRSGYGPAVTIDIPIQMSNTFAGILIPCFKS